MTEQALTPTREQILNEIEEGSKNYSFRMLFFNNLFANLPGGYRSRYSDKVLGQKQNGPNASQKMQGITLREFLTDCELAVKESGHTNEEVVENYRDFKIIQQTREVPYTDSESIKVEDKYFKMLTDVYVVLRIKGYNSDELTG